MTRHVRFALALTALTASLSGCGSQESRSLCASYFDYLAAGAHEIPVESATVTDLLNHAELARSAAERMLATGDDQLRSPIDELLGALDDVIAVLRVADGNATWPAVQPLVSDSVEHLLDVDTRVRAVLNPECRTRSRNQ